jgi:hypothetical protein
MCGRREFVAYFKPDTHIRAILEEVKIRLLRSGDDDGSTDHTLPCNREIALSSAKIFGALLTTCREVGIGLQTNIPEIVCFVATWCYQQKATSSVDELTHLLTGVAIVLRSDPDLCVPSLTRHGRPILHIVKRFVVQYNLQTGATIFTALVEYLLGHM